MGKCVSKDQHLQQIREIDERAYFAFSDEFENYHYEVSVDDLRKMAVETERREKGRKQALHDLRKFKCACAEKFLLIDELESGVKELIFPLLRLQFNP